jgi:hypothetical protein
VPQPVAGGGGHRGPSYGVDGPLPTHQDLSRPTQSQLSLRFRRSRAPPGQRSASGSPVGVEQGRPDVPLYSPPMRSPQGTRPHRPQRNRVRRQWPFGVSAVLVLSRKELDGASRLHERPRHVAGVADPQDRDRSVPMCERDWGIPARRLDASQPAGSPRTKRISCRRGRCGTILGQVVAERAAKRQAPLPSQPAPKGCTRGPKWCLGEPRSARRASEL